MAWIKRNLIFVISMIVGVILTGVAGYFVYGTLGTNAAARDNYTSALNDLTTLEQKKPFPNQENIARATQDSQKVEELAKDLSKAFVNFPAPPSVDAQRFLDYLNANVADFRVMATNAHVGLPTPDYAFSFQRQVGQLSFEGASFGIWMQQLSEIKSILAILCDAKINMLDALQRAPSGNEDPNNPDCLPYGITTNKVDVETPYKIVFHGFSDQIAHVLEGFARSEHCFLVKDIQVQTATGMPGGGFESPSEQQGQYNPNVGFDRRDPRNRFRRQRMMQQEAETPTPVPAAPTGPVTILKPMPLFVTIMVDVVQMK